MTDDEQLLPQRRRGPKAKLMLASETPWTLPGSPGVGGAAQHTAVSIFQSGRFHHLPAVGLQQITSSAALCERFSTIIYVKCLAERSTFSINVPSYWFLAQNRHFMDVNVLPNLLRGSFLITTQQKAEELRKPRAGLLGKSLWISCSATDSLCICVHAQSCLTLCALWNVAHSALLSMGFSRQEYWSGLPCSSPGGSS